MAGTKEGGLAAAATNKRKYGENFYAIIGRKGGKNGNTGGFAAGEAGRERARIYGSIGGKNSKRTHEYRRYCECWKCQNTRRIRNERIANGE